MTEAPPLPSAAVLVGKRRRRWKRYPHYKDSGVEWLGRIPSNWDVHALKHGYSVCLGKMLQSAPSSASDTLEPYLRAANVLWEGVDLSDVREMWFSPKEKAVYGLAPGDLVVCEGGETGRCALWEGQLPECYIQNAVHRVRARPGYSAKLLYYWLHALKHAGYIDALCSRATIAHLTGVKLGSLAVVRPPDADCAAVLSFLDRETAKIDALVAKKKRLIELLQEKRSALITQAVTKGLDPTVPMKDSGVEWLGEIPAHWEVLPLKRVAAVRYGLGQPPAESANGVPLIRATDVARGQINADAMMRVDPCEVPGGRDAWLSPGEIIVVRSGAYTGDSAIVPDAYSGAVAGYDLIVRVLQGHPRFFACQFLTPVVCDLQFGFYKLRAAQPHLNAEELGSTLVVAPPELEQKAI